MPSVRRKVLKALECIARLSFAAIAVCFVVPVMIILGIYKIIICSFVRRKYPELQCINTDDYWMIESYGKPSTDVLFSIVVLTLEGETTLEELKQLIWNYSLNKGNSKLLYHGVRKYGYWFWKYTENFDINHHVTYLPGLPNVTDVITDDELHTLLTHENTNRSGEWPLWRIFFVPSIMRKGDELGKKYFSLIIHIHHAYLDGFSLAQAFMTSPGSRNVDKITNTLPLRKLWLFLRGVHNLSYVIDVACLYIKVSSKKTNYNNQGSPKYHISTSAPIDLGIFRNIRTKSKSTTTSVLIASIRNAVRKISEEKPEYNFMLKSPYLLVEVQPPNLKVYPDTSNSPMFYPLLGLPRSDTHITSSTLKKLEETENAVKSCRGRAYPTDFIKLVLSLFPSVIAPQKTGTLHVNLCEIGVTSTGVIMDSKLVFEKYKCVEVQTFPPCPESALMCTSSSCCGNIRLNTVVNTSVMNTSEEAQHFLHTWKNSILEMNEHIEQELTFGQISVL